MLPCAQGKLTLKTTEMETIYDLGTKMIDALTKEKVYTRLQSTATYSCSQMTCFMSFASDMVICPCAGHRWRCDRHKQGIRQDHKAGAIFCTVPGV